MRQLDKESQQKQFLSSLDQKESSGMTFVQKEQNGGQGYDYQIAKLHLLILSLTMIGIILFMNLAQETKVKQLAEQAELPPYHPKITLGIQSVFIMKENISFMREWIIYHLNLGFDKFYLYDNTGTSGHVTIKGYSEATEKVNKYGFDFTQMIPYSQEEVAKQWQSILNQYGQHIVYVKWQPKDYAGNIIYAQPESIVHYLQNFGTDNTHTCFTDIDEFVFSEKNLNIKQYIAEKGQKGYYKLILSQKKFEDRYCHPGKKITEIYNCVDVDTKWWAVKAILLNSAISHKLPKTIHEVETVRGKWFMVPLDDWHFNHYNVNRKQLDWMQKFKYVRKDFKKCYDSGMKRYSTVIKEHCHDRCSDQNLILQYKELLQVDTLCVNQDIRYT